MGGGGGVDSGVTVSHCDMALVKSNLENKLKTTYLNEHIKIALVLAGTCTKYPLSQKPYLDLC
jgi:hypothetical protein